MLDHHEEPTMHRADDPTDHPSRASCSWIAAGAVLVDLTTPLSA